MIAEQTYLIPQTLIEALDYASVHTGNFEYLAGGTDVITNRFHAHGASSCLIDISKISQLMAINATESELEIGSLTKLADLKNIAIIQSEFPVVLAAADAVGSPVIRKSATIGGNLMCENRCIYFNQSEWWRESAGYCLKCGGDICIATQGKKACFSEIVSDMAPVLISLNAELELVDIAGTKRIRLENLYSGDGINPRNINATTIIKAIILPRTRGYKAIFKKLRQRKSLEFTSLTTAVSVDNTNKVKLALGGVDPKVVVVEGTIDDDKEILIAKCVKGARTVNNDMFTRNYRRQMIKVYLKDSFKELGL